MDLRNIDVEHRWLGDDISDERVGVLDRGEKVLEAWGLFLAACDGSGHGNL
jgi:hypothetical protein